MRTRPWRLALSIATTIATATVAATVATPAQAAPPTARAQQWYLDRLHIPQAQQITTGAGVIVAVVDTKIDRSGPSLTGQVLDGTLIGSTGTGISTAAAADHGTGMAGIIAGAGRSDNQELGIAPGAKILPVAVDDDQGNIITPSVALGIRWAADHGATVINVSLAYPAAPLPDEIAAVNYALSKDVVVVAGAGRPHGNDYAMSAPATIPGVLAVTGIDNNGARHATSATGPHAAVAAPAMNMLETVPTAKNRSGLELDGGNSPATAVVSGVAALIRARYPNLSAPNVIQRIIQTATDLGPPGRDTCFGHGLINPLAALTVPVPPVERNPLLDTPTPTGTGECQPVTGATQATDRAVASHQPPGPPTEVAMYGLVAGLLVAAGLWLATRHRLALLRRHTTAPRRVARTSARTRPSMPATPAQAERQQPSTPTTQPTTSAKASTQ